MEGFKLIAGSYERFLFGYEVKASPSDVTDSSNSDEPGKLSQSISYGAHLGSIKCVDASGSIAVSGGNDDIVKIYDLKAKKDVGPLIQHSGAITCLKLYGRPGHPTHLLSGSEDKTIHVWDSEDWAHLIELKGHKAAVNDLSVHPSGRLALSVSKDAELRLWNLMKGKLACKSKLNQEAKHVMFSPHQGANYAAVFGKEVVIFDIESGKETQRMMHERPVFCVAQNSEKLLLSGGEEGLVRTWDYNSGKCVLSFSASATRLRGLVIIPEKNKNNEPESLGLPNLIATASSDGYIKVWDLRKISSDLSQEGSNSSNIATKPLYQAQTNARLTCLAVGGSAKGHKLAKSEPEVTGNEARGAKSQKTKKRKDSDNVTSKPKKKI